MVHTDKLEKEERAGATYWDALCGTNLRRTEIACMAFMSHITNGGALCYSGSFFFQQVGIEDHVAYAITLGGKGLCFVGTVLSWFYIHRFGRRTIWLYGFTTLTLILWTIGFLSLPKQNLPLGWGQSLLCVIWLGVYSMSVGPIVYTLVAEIGSTRLRTQTVVLGRSVYYFGNIIFGGILQPKFMSPGDWNLKGKTVSICCTIVNHTAPSDPLQGILLGRSCDFDVDLGILPPGKRSKHRDTNTHPQSDVRGTVLTRGCFLISPKQRIVPSGKWIFWYVLYHLIAQCSEPTLGVLIRCR